MRFYIAAAAALLVITAGPAFAGGSGPEMTRPDTDIRALEPPIDVTPEQLRAQGTLVDPAPVAGPGHARHRLHRRHRRHAAKS